MSKGGAVFLITLGVMATVDFVGGAAWCANNGHNFVGTLCIIGMALSLRIVFVGGAAYAKALRGGNQ